MRLAEGFVILASIAACEVDPNQLQLALTASVPLYVIAFVLKRLFS